jgi:hypothetical protein
MLLQGEESVVANRSETGLELGPDLDRATGHVIIENELVRVMRWNFAHWGDATGWHRHKPAYVIGPLVDGRLEIDHVGGTDVSGLTKAGCYFPQSGVEDDVPNGNDCP